jgi:hypothetical protein
MRHRARQRGGRAAAIAGIVGLVAASSAVAQPASDAGVVRFVYPDTLVQSVSLGGDFNGWSPTATPLDREGPVWVTRVFLDPGTYEYKFMVDGEWHTDRANPEVSPAGNSVVRVGGDGEVLPPRPSPVGAGTSGVEPGAGGGAIGWSLRYVGLVTSRRDRDLDRYELVDPLHDIDLRLDARLTPELSGWFLTHVDNRGDGASSRRLALRYDRSLIEWRPGRSSLRLFDNVGVTTFDDPGALVGHIGIYDDEFGYLQRGVGWRQRILGAPLELLYSDDTEPRLARLPLPPFPDLSGAPAAALAGDRVRGYVSSPDHTNADLLAMRARGGTGERGAGIGVRIDRGRSQGLLSEINVTQIAPDTLTGTGRLFTTTETSRSWQLDARYRWRDVRIQAEYLGGDREAVAHQAAPVRLPPPTLDPASRIGEPAAVNTRFHLDTSHRAVVRLSLPHPHGPLESPWSVRPGTGRLVGGELAYDYEEHDYDGLVTGTPFLIRRHTGRGGVEGHRFGIRARFDAEQHWFRYPSAAVWDTQFWFRRQNFWLDEDTASLERLTLLGMSKASVLRAHAARSLWERHGLLGELHATYAAPGFDAAPRYVEGILRLTLPLPSKLELRTHSRLSVYRRFESSDPGVIAALGPGEHFEAGLLPPNATLDASHSYRAFSNHFVELVYAITARSDIALGFGVDPIVIYEVTNEYEPIGWDEFLFAAGASPRAALEDPAGLGPRLENADRALERERRLSLEARLRF